MRTNDSELLFPTSLMICFMKLTNKMVGETTAQGTSERKHTNIAKGTHYVYPISLKRLQSISLLLNKHPYSSINCRNLGLIQTVSKNSTDNKRKKQKDSTYRFTIFLSDM